MKKCMYCNQIVDESINLCPNCSGRNFEIDVEDTIELYDIPEDGGNGNKPLPLIYEQSEKLKEISKNKEPSRSQIHKHSPYCVDNFRDIYSENGHAEEITRVYNKKDDEYHEIIKDLTDNKIKVNKIVKLSEKNE